MKFLGDVVAYFTSASTWSGADGIVHRAAEHTGMSVLAVLAGVVIALPVGLALGHTGRGGALTISVSNLGRAVPSFAIIVIAASVFGIGAEPAFIALVALAIPPIVTNTYVAIDGVDTDAKDAARGLGYTGGQLLRRVEMPLALPLIMAGIRTSAVQVVATATLAALVGWGGLGRYIIDGLATRDFVEVFAGALLVALLSIATEVVLAGVQRVIVPRGLRRAAVGGAGAGGEVATLPGVAGAGHGAKR
ncbi:MAG TPA: ABC transporter permease [Acidimicrobiales bacterium]|nr:ABC transporter permease [Acidimicrobiales bacterium]